MRLVKLDADDVEYPAVVLDDDGSHLVVEGPWAEADPRDLGFVRFQAGDVFTEHYWRDRWYSIKAVRDLRGEFKGWYCDVARPVRVEAGLVVSEDLVLDLWRSADGTTLRLDEAEFRASDLATTDPHAARRALAALDELESMAADAFGELTSSSRG